MGYFFMLPIDCNLLQHPFTFHLKILQLCGCAS
jgi:hypothetical protein